MATRRRRLFGIGGATAVAAFGVLAAIATGAPTGVGAPAVTRLPVHVTWTTDAAATGYDVRRADGACAGASGFGSVGTVGAAVASLDDTPLANGTFCYEVVGLYGMDPEQPGNPRVSVLYDTALPLVTFASPMAAATVRGTVTVQANASDPGGGGAASGLASLAYTLDGSPFAGGQWNTATVAGGPHTLVATAVDVAGNSAQAAVTVTVDNTPPPAFTVSAQSPVAGRPTLSWPTSSEYTYTVARAGAALGVATSPWTDPVNPGAGSHTYVVTATDAALNTTSSSVTVLVIATSATAPRSVSAPSPTNVPPHLTWQKPSTFAVTGWRISRDGAVVKEIGDPDVMAFDDTAVGSQGPHVYVVEALSGGVPGDPSSPITVTYDTVAPSLGAPTGVANPNGSVAVSWPDASDPAPGAGVASYVVRRSAGAPPSEVVGGTAVCTVALPAATGCVDLATVSGTTYGYSVFALDSAGNATRQTVMVRPVDNEAPDPATDFRGSVGPTSVNLTWNVPARQGRNADLAGYRLIRLAAGATAPTNPRDGTEACPGLASRSGDCSVRNLTTGRKVTFALYALDEVPNYSTPALLTVTPKGDSKKPGKATKVRVTRVGARITMRWVSPKDSDLSHFVVNLNKNGPAKNPGVRPIILKGRKLAASFTLRAGQVAYANLFSVDLSGNYSRVTRRIAMPDKIVVAKSKQKAVKKKVPARPKKTTSPAKPAVPKKAVSAPKTVVIVAARA